MVLKKIKIIVAVFVFGFSEGAFSQSEDAEMRDFVYKVDLHLEENKNMVGMLSELVSESEIKAGIQSLRTFEQSGKRVANMYSLVDRIEKDVEQIYKKAHTLGFYNAEVRYKILSNMKPVRVEMYVDMGRVFDLDLNLEFEKCDDQNFEKYKKLLHKKAITYKSSIPEIRQLINDALFTLKSNGFFNPKVTEKKVYIDYKKKKAILNLKIIPGDCVKFAKTKIKAFPDISEHYIRNRIEWKEGELFNIEKIEKTAENLRDSQIFSTIEIEPIADQKKDDQVPMEIILGKNKTRMIDASLLYSGTRQLNFKKNTSSRKKLRSVIARLAWTNFNAFGSGETLGFAIEGNPGKSKMKTDPTVEKTENDKKSEHRDYLFEVSLSKPDVFIKNFTMIGGISRKQELSNAFFKKSDKISIIGDYPLSSDIHARVGFVSEKNDLDSNEIFFADSKAHKKYENYSIPCEIFIDKTDDLLNPTSGYKASAKFTRIQFHNAALNGLNLVDTNFSYNHYLDETKRNIVALNLGYKIILNGDVDDIPLDKRIYAGGINSVRGYGNQMATEMVTAEKVPMGGKASLEFNAEYRRKITSDFGMVLFFDGAKVYKNKSSKTELAIEKKRWFLATGLGLRYFSSLGPIRVDFAFPLRKRKGIDSKMQFIISLGQAF